MRFFLLLQWFRMGNEIGCWWTAVWSTFLGSRVTKSARATMRSTISQMRAMLRSKGIMCGNGLDNAQAFKLSWRPAKGLVGGGCGL
jgi:hypothetical protein